MSGETTLFKSRIILILVLMVMLSSVKTQTVIPSRYATFQPIGVLSANGSSLDGNCTIATSTTEIITILNITTCTAPTSTVLFDEIIPTLTGLDGNMWASQLLTLYGVNNGLAFLNFDFSGTEDYTGVNRVEVVIVNCPDMGIIVNEISLVFLSFITSVGSGSQIFATATVMNTSCNSLVTVHIPCANQHCRGTLLGIRINTPSNSIPVYIAEIRFCATETCPTFPSVFTTENVHTTTLPSPNPITSATLPPLNPAIANATTMPSPESKNVTTITTNRTETTDLPIIVSAATLVFLILVCVVVVVLLLWRCYCAKHHKHNTTALGEGTHASLHPHSHTPPITLCEETGQALYSVVQDEALEDGHYSHLQHGTNKVWKKDQLHEVDTGIDQLYSQVDNKKSKEKDAIATNLPVLDANTENLDQMYAQVDKNKSKKKGATVMNPSSSETNTAVDQLYAQVDKKNKKKNAMMAATNPASETETVVNHLYAQVDKKKNKKRSKEINKDSAEESGAVYYSVVK